MNCRPGAIFGLHGNLGLPEDIHGLLHVAGGLGASPHLWRALADHSRTATLLGFSRFLNELASPCVLRPCVLLGYSLGGRLALHTITGKPQRWDAAIIISAHPGLRTKEERAARLLQDRSWAARFRSEPWPKVMAAWNAQEVFQRSEHGVEPAGTVSAPERWIALEPWRAQIALAFDAWSLGRQAAQRPLLPGVRGPVLWITGEKDTRFTALAKESCALLPAGRHVIIPDAGHRVHLDQPVAVHREVGAFLQSLPAA
jgi:2-succinyl-6-hydroxy-2,4-cyclohexadiene-1-carboxylate synthase